MKKRIFISGGAGFIGSSIVHRLVHLGYETASFDASLNFIDNDTYYKRCLMLRKSLFAQPSIIYQADIRNYESLSKAVGDFHPDVIVHLAGLPMARVNKKFEDQMIPINMTGTLNILDIFEKSNAERIVYTSSSMAYGHFHHTPQPENTTLNPINTYGACKAAGEYFVKLSHKDWVIVRPTSVYGFTDCANRVSQILIDAAHNNTPVWVVKGETLDFTYIDDVADGFVSAILSPKSSHEIFNISFGVARCAVEFAEILKGYFPNFQYEICEPQSQQVNRGPQDISKAHQSLGFQPKYSIEQGIKKILELIQENNFYHL